MTAQQARVRVIATGGSIAGIGPDRLDYILYPELGRHLTIEQSLARIPEVNLIAQVQGEDLISVGSTAIGHPRPRPPAWRPSSFRRGFCGGL